MWQFVCGLVQSLWFAWGVAGLFLITTLCSIFRTSLGIEGCMLSLMTQTAGTQAGIIKNQQGLIDAQQVIIAACEAEMRLAGLLPWDDDENENDGS